MTTTMVQVVFLCVTLEGGRISAIVERRFSSIETVEGVDAL